MNCAKCGRSILGQGYPTPLGERVCRPCSDKINGFVYGSLSGGAAGGMQGASLTRWARAQRRRPK